MRNFHSFLVACLLLLIVSSCQTKHQNVTQIVFNAVIWTGNEKQPFAEAMAINGDTLLAVGSHDEIMKYKGDQALLTDVNGKDLASFDTVIN